MKRNRICASILVGVGVLSTLLSKGDATFLVFSLLIGVPAFFSKENWIE